VILAGCAVLGRATAVFSLRPLQPGARENQEDKIASPIVSERLFDDGGHSAVSSLGGGGG
jgi:hypothetical protein